MDQLVDKFHELDVVAHTEVSKRVMTPSQRVWVEVSEIILSYKFEVSNDC